MIKKLLVSIADESDFEMLASLGKRAFQEAFGEYNDPANMQTYLELAFNPDNIKLQLQNPDVTFLVARYEGDPVGYAKLKRNSAPPELEGVNCIQLERIYALRDFIGKKVGKALMEECIRISKSENIKSIWLGVWQQNTRAIDFYKKWGFKIIGYKQFVIGNEVNDDYVLALDMAG